MKIRRIRTNCLCLLLCLSFASFGIGEIRFENQQRSTVGYLDGSGRIEDASRSTIGFFSGGKVKDGGRETIGLHQRRRTHRRCRACDHRICQIGWAGRERFSLDDRLRQP